MSLRHDERISPWLRSLDRADKMERVLGIAGGLLLVGFIGVCATMSVVLW